MSAPPDAATRKMASFDARLTTHDKQVIATAFVLLRLWRPEDRTPEGASLAAAAVQAVGLDRICRVALLEQDDSDLEEIPLQIVLAMERTIPGFSAAINRPAQLGPVGLVSLLSRWERRGAATMARPPA